MNGEKGMHIGYWQESQKERGNHEDHDVREWIIVKRILERLDWLEWIGLIWFRIRTIGRLF
jgi:hypothetical protein